MYQNPAATLVSIDGQSLEFDEEEARKHFEAFYEDVSQELVSFGEIEEINICDNLGPHLVGNVYVKYANEEAATSALLNLQGRFYAGILFLLFFFHFEKKKKKISFLT
jgi:splicing factor U2AF subunit